MTLWDGTTLQATRPRALTLIHIAHEVCLPQSISTSWSTVCHVNIFANTPVPSHSEEDELSLAVKQYVPIAQKTNNDRGGIGITVVGFHALGCPKELYEPLWDSLYEYTQQSGKIYIANIFIADAVNHGQSGIWNEKLLGNARTNFALITEYIG
jgi:hypothetical protein